MVTYLSDEQKTLVEKIISTLFEMGIPYEFKDHSQEGGSYITLKVKDHILYVYDDGEAEISGSPHDIHFEIYDFNNHTQLIDKYIDRMKERLLSE